MSQTDSSFFIAKENIEAALKAIKNLHGHETIKDSSGPHFSWVDNNFFKINNFEDMMGEWRWEVEYNDNGDVDSISFTGEKSGDELKLFQAIAPFVKKDSFIEMDGEDNCMWRWVFDGTTCKEIYPTVTW